MFVVVVQELHYHNNRFAFKDFLVVSVRKRLQEVLSFIGLDDPVDSHCGHLNHKVGIRLVIFVFVEVLLVKGLVYVGKRSILDTNDLVIVGILNGNGRLVLHFN